MAKTVVKSQQTVCQRIYMPINAVRSLACYRSLKLNKITLKKGVKYRFWIGGSRCFCSQSFFFFVFFFFILFYLVFFLPPISYLVLTFPSLFSLPPLLSCQLPRRQCCHGYRAAGQISWCLVSFRHVHKSASCMCARSLPSLQWAPALLIPLNQTQTRAAVWPHILYLHTQFNSLHRAV